MPEEKKEEEKKKLSPFALLGGVIASVGSMLLGAKLKTDGTIPGAAIGSVSYSVIAYAAETRSQKHYAKIRAHWEKGKDGEPGTYKRELQDLPLERTLNQERSEEVLQTRWNPRRKLAFTGGMLAFCGITAVGTLLTIEAATGQTLHSNLSNQKQYGTTFGYSTQSPSPAVVSPSVTYSPTYSPSPSATFSASPMATPSPSATVTPSGTCTTPTCTAVSQ